MQIVRLYDRTREPRGWMQIIRPTEFAVFAACADSGAPCDIDGTATSADDASCVIFATLSEAEAFCRERVVRIPTLRFDILDAAGHRRPPLLTIVHPSRIPSLEGSPAKMRRNAYAAIALLAIGPPLVWFDWALYDGEMVMPTIVGINAPLIALRLLIMNRSQLASERMRRERVAQALGSRKQGQV
jgi:hypothetical protein